MLIDFQRDSSHHGKNINLSRHTNICKYMSFISSTLGSFDEMKISHSRTIKFLRKKDVHIFKHIQIMLNL